ncbi:chaperone NapD [Psychromonas sp. Urea-02u-13]|uniref:chaperone NapD n=1 Tax=Psychromonas sp. Urea-02u-13 TaxID=2058326 RepID=UPI000C32F9A6|nr:chaperone NapD [Psychromonas sp. Urea-02u-13]PKG39301.1 sorbose reductase [Psychromonas sp. Urea-02u-13]
MKPEELHISSLIVHVNILKVDMIRAKINLLQGAEVITVSEQGKAIVVLEAPNQRIIMEVIDSINEIDGVINTGLVYHEFEKAEA